MIRKLAVNLGTLFNRQQAPFSGTVAGEQIIKIQSSIALINIFQFFF
jgi:hypothetical protein